MRSRPKPLIYLMLALFAVAISFPLQIMWLYGHPWAEISAVWPKLTWLNWVVMGGSVLTGVMLYRAVPGAQRMMYALIGAVAVNNFFVGYYATDFSPWTAGFATLAFGALSLPLRNSEVRELLNHPERRWWRASSRKRLNVPIFLGGSRKTILRSETFDISESGAFIPVEAPLKIEERVSICLTLNTFQQIRCDGKVVRITEACGCYPAGFGIEFCNLDWSQRRELRRFLHNKTSQL